MYVYVYIHIYMFIYTYIYIADFFEKFCQALPWGDVDISLTDAIAVAAASATPVVGLKMGTVGVKEASEASEEEEELEQPSLLLPKTPNKTTRRGWWGVTTSDVEGRGTGEEEEEEEEEEVVFEMVLDLDAEELVGCEEEFKAVFARDLSRAMSLRPLAMAADAMARTLLATPTATPCKLLQQESTCVLPQLPSQLVRDTTTHGGEGGGGCVGGGDGEDDDGDEVETQAFTVRGLIFEPAAVIVELSWYVCVCVVECVHIYKKTLWDSFNI